MKPKKILDKNYYKKGGNYVKYGEKKDFIKGKGYSVKAK